MVPGRKPGPFNLIYFVLVRRGVATRRGGGLGLGLGLRLGLGLGLGLGFTPLVAWGGGGGPGVPVTPSPLGRPSFEQETHNIQVAQTP